MWPSGREVAIEWQGGHKVIEWPRRTKGGHGVNKGGHGVARWQGGAIAAGRWLQRRP